MRILATLAAAIVITLAGCAGTTGTPAEQAREISGRIWSPYCPGRLLSECSTAQSEELRDRIETRLQEGESSAEVLTWLRENYGEEILAEPPPTAAGLAVWLVPVAATLGGLIVAAGLIRRWSRGDGTQRRSLD